MAKLNWGIIGCGDVFKNKSGPAIQHSFDSCIQIVMQRDAEGARECAKQFNVEEWTDNAFSVLENKRVDIVYVATPPSTHLKYVQLAAKAGKHVLVEKPMGIKSEESLSMVKTCKETGVELFVAYYRRFYPHIVSIRKLISEGLIGRVKSFLMERADGDFVQRLATGRFTWREDVSISGGGPFIDQGSHRIDLAIALFGPIVEASSVINSFSTTLQIEKEVNLSLKFNSGVSGVIYGDFSSGRNVDILKINGEKGVIVSDPIDSYSFTLLNKFQTKKHRFSRYPAPHLGLIRHIEAVLLANKDNQVSGTEGVMTEKILDENIRNEAINFI